MAEDTDRASGETGQGQGGPPPDRPGQDRPDDKKPKKPGPLQNPLVLVGIAVVVVIVVVAAVLWWLDARRFQTTDDAFIDTHIVRLAPQTTGRIISVRANDNMPVQAGQLLVEIDSSETQTQLNQAEAQRAQAMAARSQAEGQLIQARAQIRSTEAAAAQAASQAVAQQAQAGNAQRDYERYHGLQAANPAAVAQQQLDQSQTQASTTAAQARAALDQARSAAAQVGTARGQAAAAEGQIKAADAQIGAAEAQIANVKINLSYTRLVAPVPGHVTQLNIAPGSYVQPGQQVMAIVPNILWVTANFKETQLAYMRPGQPVDFSIAACGGEKLTGHVDSIQRGAGQAFQLLPAENATGNYVKVVQRVPVKIVFDQAPKHCVLGPGMSVSPRVKVR